jgi:NAD(P)-dependent dehydrogenase (short-subunit alcohol dehydrogenase family)
MRFTHRNILITGASTGIGLATARRVREEGANVHLTATSGERLDQAAAALRSTPFGDGAGMVATSVLDVRDVASLTAFAEQVRSHGAAVDAVFVNAGVTYAAPTAQVSQERFDDEMAVNARGTFFTVTALAPVIRDGGSVVLNTSCLDELGAAGTGVYAASKAAVRSLTRTFSVELKERGIRVNAVSPGPTDTPIYGKFGMPADDLAAMADGIRNVVPVGRFAEASEIAAVAAFLLSDDSSYMLGAEVVVDGGWTQL